MTSQVVKVTVYIDDVNDNVPRFVQPLVTGCAAIGRSHGELCRRFVEPLVALSLSESASPGSTYVIPAAVDADSPQFAVQRYELDSLTDKFGLEVTQNIDGTQEVNYN